MTNLSALLPSWPDAARLIMLQYSVGAHQQVKLDRTTIQQSKSHTQDQKVRAENRVEGHAGRPAGSTGARARASRKRAFRQRWAPMQTLRGSIPHAQTATVAAATRPNHQRASISQLPQGQVWVQAPTSQSRRNSFSLVCSLATLTSS